MKNIDVKGTITEKSETREVYSRYGYNVHRVSYAVLSDGANTIKLILWNDQIDQVSIGDTIQIENGYVSQFRGITQLNVGKRNGKIIIVNE
jgi:ssDNA-binding replication factor A large subunit